MSSTSIRTLDSTELLSLVSQLTDAIQQNITPSVLLEYCCAQLQTSEAWLFEQYHLWDECHFFHTPDSSFSEDEGQVHISKHEFELCHPYIAMASTSDSSSNYCSQLTFKLTTRENLASIYLYLEFRMPQPQALFTSMEFVLFLNIVRLYFSERASFKNNFFHSLNISEFYQDIVDDAPVMIYALNEQQRIVMWNKQCEQVFGWSKQELQQFEQPLKLFYPDKKYRDRVLKQSAQNTGSKKLKEWNPLHRDGSMLTTLWAQLLLPDQTTLNFGIDITEQRKAEKILKTRARIDGLTQCFNRDEILHQLEELLKDSQNQSQDLPFCVFMLDLDHFKSINDTWGHLAGDESLIHFSQLLRSYRKQNMTVGRFGGEEFLLIMKVSSLDEAMEFDSRLRATLQNHPLMYHDQTIKLNYSAGVVLIEQGCCNLTHLLTSVDQALYHAKKTGRGRTIQAEEHF
ncbi:sensor domain-containing diguanylate cyclase [Acinetobacter sp. ANC 4633]|uniref:sensor domain-containing diguanylate cyclase n=1 Tax=Acinetobacter sp. ANC 4633 TaxID=2529845 RepID=UPI00103AB93A|nr:sensor domain-containing diguanylate cyclase [Acinetobacter sp. ANC 4633]TCB26413.1 sensor domain-containing diguanylate cyclase [Acinetobacter sp. ANC 4633]